MAYRVQCIINDDLENELRQALQQISTALPTSRDWDTLTPAETKEYIFLSTRHPEDVPQWKKDHGFVDVKVPKSLNALIVGLLKTVTKYSPEELAAMMADSGVRLPGRPSEG
jgi:hypothetical protein